MPLYVPYQTPRQIAEAVVQAVMDAAIATRNDDVGEQQVRLGDAVLEALKGCGIELVGVEVPLEAQVRES